MPLGLFERERPEQPIDVAIKSSTISLGLVEGITDVVRNVTGEITLDVKAVGTSRDPHIERLGRYRQRRRSWSSPTGSPGTRTRAPRSRWRTDRVTVESLHVEDVDGHPLDVRGSLGTHELRVGELEIEATARQLRGDAQRVRGA